MALNLTELLKRAMAFKRVILRQVPDATLEKAADEVVKLKGEIETIVNAYLVAQLGPIPGYIATRVADSAIATVAVAIETALRDAK